MTSRERRRGRIIPALATSFWVGVAAGWWLHATFVPRTATPRDISLTEEPKTPGGTGASTNAEAIEELRRRDLRLPVDGANVEAMKDGFTQRRDGDSRGHEAVDIPAARGTPVHAGESGTIAKLFESKAGGITVYQLDSTGQYCYYYAHLDRYAPGLREGQSISRGEVIGYVGTTGNAPAGAPHLHFAVYRLGPDQRWWEGTPLDPYPVFSRERLP